MNRRYGRPSPPQWLEFVAGQGPAGMQSNFAAPVGRFAERLGGVRDGSIRDAKPNHLGAKFRPCHCHGGRTHIARQSTRSPQRGRAPARDDFVYRILRATQCHRQCTGQIPGAYNCDARLLQLMGIRSSRHCGQNSRIVRNSPQLCPGFQVQCLIVRACQRYFILVGWRNLYALSQNPGSPARLSKPKRASFLRAPFIAVRFFG